MVVYDEVLPQDQFSSLWIAVQQDRYLMPHVADWQKVWRLTDGTCVGSKECDTSREEPQGYISLAYSMFSELARLHPAIVPEWTSIIMRSYLYPRGTKLSWHNDLGYSGAAIFYVHPEWSSTWGGELMVAKTPSSNSVPPPHLDHREEDRFLEAYGTGIYVTCRPNRLVLTRPGVWHSINRVDADAGDHCRASIVGFFKNEKK